MPSGTWPSLDIMQIVREWSLLFMVWVIGGGVFCGDYMVLMVNGGGISCI